MSELTNKLQTGQQYLSVSSEIMYDAIHVLHAYAHEQMHVFFVGIHVQENKRKHKPIIIHIFVDLQNFLTGLNLTDLSATFSRNSTYPVTTAMPTQSSITTSVTSTAPIHQPSPPNFELLQPTKGTTSYRAPTLMQSQKESKNDTGMDLLSGPNFSTNGSMSSTGVGASKPAPSGMTGWPSNNPLSNTMASSGHNSIQIHSNRAGASIFSGLDTNSSGDSYQSLATSRDNATGIFGGMNLNQTQSSPSVSQRQMMNQQPSLATKGTAGIAQPLVPTNVGGHGHGGGRGYSQSGNHSTGWSSNSMGVEQNQTWNGSHGSGGSQPAMQSHSQQVSGWSNSISGLGSRNVGGQSSGSGWSQGIGTNPAGMQPSGIPFNVGTNLTNIGQNSGSYQLQSHPGSMGMPPMNPNSGPGMNWPAGGMQQQIPQPVVHGQPLIPTTSGGMTGGWGQGQASSLQQQQQAAGANPFADLSFLS